jgi:hypothetical protein
MTTHDPGASRRRSLEHVRNAIQIVKRVIAENQTLASQHPDHRESAEQRIREGHAELETLTREEDELSRP